jgi:hypothetical protein
MDLECKTQRGFLFSMLAPLALIIPSELFCSLINGLLEWHLKAGKVQAC